MSQHWTPEDDTATGSRPGVQGPIGDDVEGHGARQDEEPDAGGQFRAQDSADDESDTEGHLKALSGDKAAYRVQDGEDDTEGHARVADKTAYRVQDEAGYRVQGEEDDTEGHIRVPDKTAYRVQSDEDDATGHLSIRDAAPGTRAWGEQPGAKTKQHDEDDTEGHFATLRDKTAYRVQDDDVEGHRTI